MRLDQTSGPPFGQVRRAFWALLIVALVLATAVPTALLLRAASTALQVRACLWPPAPHAQSTVYVVVTALDVTDRTALHGPWAQVAADWDMLTMAMGRRHAARSGPSADHDTLAVPLVLSMAGPWWAQVRVQTPGRPTWQTQLAFSVLPAVPTTGPPLSSSHTAIPACVS
jgi:hypothetical protein